ncbi:aldo/keto reductase [Enterobacter sp. C2]|uniref:aldo/keto reductase n=1 Tax=Enterobacter sp. C2 TaxID=2870346 RepID=UPI001CA452B8|nr:aldo/keto reductase [Enterobacter sp. C2]
MNSLPKIALGTWSWGTGVAGGDTIFGNHLKDEQMQEIFRAGIAEGLTLWDTAPVYGMGSSEQALGKVIQECARDDVILSTKFTPQIANEMVEKPLETMLMASLQRLGVDFIDIYWIHNPQNVEKWTPDLIPLLQKGLIKRVGVSNHNLAQIQRVNEILGQAGYTVSAVQNHYSLLYRSSEKAGVIEYCHQNNIIFFAYMVLEQGALSGRYNSHHPMPAGSNRAISYNSILPELQELTDVMQEIADIKEASVAQIAVAWAICKGTLPIVGATRLRHVTDAAMASTILLTPEEITRLELLADKTGIDTRGAWEEPMESLP